MLIGGQKIELPCFIEAVAITPPVAARAKAQPYGDQFAAVRPPLVVRGYLNRDGYDWVLAACGKLNDSTTPVQDNHGVKNFICVLQSKRSGRGRCPAQAN
jgi:hypothetical protein